MNLIYVNPKQYFLQKHLMAKGIAIKKQELKPEF